MNKVHRPDCRLIEIRLGKAAGLLPLFGLCLSAEQDAFPIFTQ